LHLLVENGLITPINPTNISQNMLYYKVSATKTSIKTSTIALRNIIINNNEKVNRKNQSQINQNPIRQKAVWMWSDDYADCAVMV
jgi:hypothetical protein